MKERKMVPFSFFATKWAYKVLALHFACPKSKSGTSLGRMPNITTIIEAGDRVNMQKALLSQLIRTHSPEVL